VGEPFDVSLFQQVSGIEIFHAKEGGNNGFVEKFLSHRTKTKNFVWEPFSLLKTFWYQKIKEKKKEGGEPRFFVRIVMPHTTKIFARGNLLCIGKFRASKKFLHKRGVS